MEPTRKEKTNRKSDSKMAQPLPEPTGKVSGKPPRRAVEKPVEIQVEPAAMQPSKAIQAGEPQPKETQTKSAGRITAAVEQKPDRKAKKGTDSKEIAVKLDEPKSSGAKARAPKKLEGMRKTVSLSTTSPQPKTLPQPKPAERQSAVPPTTPPAETTLSTIPRTPHDIPGLGPIRVRALQKAGLESLAALHAAPLELLTKVPGMSPIKAQQIKAFLDALPEIPPPLPPIPVQTKLLSPVLHTVSAEAGETWEFAARQTTAQAVALLTNPLAPDYRASLLRELVRYASRMPGWLNAFTTQTERDRERAVRRMHRIGELLTEASAQPDIDRKAQTRLSEDLSDASDRLDALTGTGEPASREKAGGEDT